MNWGCAAAAPVYAAAVAAAAALLGIGGMLGIGGKMWGLSAGEEPEPKRAKSYDSAVGSYKSSGGMGLEASGGLLLPVDALLAGGMEVASATLLQQSRQRKLDFARIT